MKRLAVSVAMGLFAGAAMAFTQFSMNPRPQSEDPNSWWQKRFAEKQALVKAGGSEVVFIGDSIIHGLDGSKAWRENFAGEPFKALNLGFSGDRTEHVLWRLDHGELDGYRAKAVVLMIGTNNTGHRGRDQETPIDTICGLREIMRKIQQKQPQAKIVLHPIFPRDELPTGEKRQRNEIVNGALRQLADGQSIIWCDFNDRLLDADGVLHKEMCGDFLHPGDKGRDIWAETLVPVLKRIVAEDSEAKYPRAARAISRPMREYVDRMCDRRRWLGNSKTDTFDVVFLGDSITHYWDGNGKNTFKQKFADYKIYNLGHSGDRTEHLVWRFLNGELEGYKAKLFMLMIGTNNGGDSAEDVAAGIKRIIEIVKAKHPESKVLLLPIFPRGGTAGDGHRRKNEKTNAIIKDYADGRTVLWCDFNDKFLVGENKELPRTLMPDLLHPNEDGYTIWADSVLPIFRQCCGK